MSSDQALSTREEAPIPPRYRSIKRIVLATATLLVLLSGLRWWWGREAHRRLNDEIARLRAFGEPILPEDFDAPEIPDQDNAVILIRQAVAALTVAAPDDQLWSLLQPGVTPSATTLDAIAGALEASDHALELMRNARTRSGVDWHDRVRSPAWKSAILDFRGCRQLVKMLNAAAVYHSYTGDACASLGSIRDMLALGRAIDQRPALIAHLVTIADDGLAAHAIESVAPRLTLAEVSGDPGRGATRQQVTALIDELLDERSLRDGLVAAFRAERMLMVDNARVYARGGFDLNSGNFADSGPYQRLAFAPIRPLFELDAVRILRFGTAWVHAVQAPNWRELATRAPLDPSPGPGLRHFTHVLTNLLTPSLGRVAQLHYRDVALRRMAATSLAIRLYELDHGHRPPHLAELVPAYLPAVPIDPYVATDQPIGFRPDDDPPVLYCVNIDGIDQSGRFATRFGTVNDDGADLVFFLNGDRPRPLPPGQTQTAPTSAPSTQAGKHEDDVENDERNANDDQGAQSQP